MKHISPYHLFESESEPIRKVFTREQINWLDRYSTEGWKYNPATGKVDVKGAFTCAGQGLKDFKGVEFGVISGSFSCSNNQLTSLVGAPEDVDGSFYCQENKLENLIGAPKNIWGNFVCHHNLLTSLEGAPEMVADNYHFEHNPVRETTLDRIYSTMTYARTGYEHVLRSLWNSIDVKDQALLYRPTFNWVSPEESKKLASIKKYLDIQNLI